ncbi:MAG: TetR/AcrR family transcriptional regulator [Firmicutes bacterium]|nr:TetR/AcrR family transcriptional regulator [Bacillota bacterium]
MNKKQEANAFVIECITTALLNMMEKQSFDSISITELTNRAGVGRASFYRNFESKEDVIKKYLHTLIEKWRAEYKGTTSIELVQAIFEHYRKNKELSILLYKQGLAHISLQSVKDSCGAKPEQDNNTAYFSAFFSHGLYGWIEEWFKRGMQETPEEMAMLFVQTRNRFLKERSE